MNREIIILIAAVELAVGASAAPAEDKQQYPSRPIRLIVPTVPTVPGPPPDVVARMLGERLAGALVQRKRHAAPPRR